MNVVELNRYDGAANIECSTTPEGGRSGGGLFNSDGEIIGICSAADKDLNEGIYAGPAAIFAMLDKLELTHLYDAKEGRRVAAESLATNDSELTTPTIEHAPTNLQELMNSVGDDAEITCIINPKSGGDSRVVIIHKATPQFVDWLEGELEQQPQPAMHTMRANSKSAGDTLTRKPQRILDRPLLTSDASHSRTWPYTVRRPFAYGTKNNARASTTRNTKGPTKQFAIDGYVPGSSNPQPYRRPSTRSK